MLLPRIFRSHPKSGDLGIAATLVAVYNRLHGVFDCPYSDFEIAAYSFQVFLQVPYALSCKLGAKTSASPKAGNFTPRFRIWRFILIRGQEARDLELICWEYVDGQHMRERLLRLIAQSRDLVQDGIIGKA